VKGEEQIWSADEIYRATGGRLVAGRKDVSCKGISTDSRTVKKGNCFVALPGEKYDGHAFIQKALNNGAKGLVVSESYISDISDRPLDWAGVYVIAVPDTLKALGDIATFHRERSRVSVVAITGTNGKTTTKEMTARILERSFSVLKTRGNFNNLIGLPLTLLRLNPAHEWAVLELAMNHPGEIERLARICNPQLGVITNIAPGHLEGVRDLDGVMHAKGELLEVLGEGGTAILNIDDPKVCQLAERFPGRVVPFGVHRAAEVWAVPFHHTASGCSFDLHWQNMATRVHLRTPGLGAIYNAVASAAVGYQLGLSIDEVKEGLESTPSVPGRMTILDLPGGIHLIDDTYNANPGSMTQAIETLTELKGNSRGILITGDMLELGEHSVAAHKELGALAAKSDISHLYATGEFAKTVAEGAKRAGMNGKQVSVCNPEEIVKEVTKRLAPGDWVLVKGSRLMAMERIVDALRAKSITRNQ